MGIFLSKAALVLQLVQTPHPDSVRAELWARVAADSTNGPAWLELGRAYLQRDADYHTHKKPMTGDTGWAHATPETAQMAFERAARFRGGTPAAGPAPVYRADAVREWAC